MLRAVYIAPAFLAAALSACFPARRVVFVEPAWGDAPPPVPAAVTEITLEHMRCRHACSYERVSLRRDGHASRTFSTGKHLDSTLVATIDSLTYRSLASRLAEEHFFTRYDGDGYHQPLATESYVVSAATLCRRAVGTFSSSDPTKVLAVPQVIDSVVAGLPWALCCRA